MKHAYCEFCDKTPSFGLKEDNIRKCCALHKKENMINLTVRKCYLCDRSASFGYLRGKSMICCKIHSESGMIHNSKRSVDIVLE